MTVLEILQELKQLGIELIAVTDPSLEQWQQWLERRNVLLPQIGDFGELAASEERSAAVTLIEEIRRLDAVIIACAEGRLANIRDQIAATATMRRFLPQKETYRRSALFVKVA